MSFELAPDLVATLRAGIVAWDRESSKGTGRGEFLYILSDRERDALAERLAGIVQRQYLNPRRRARRGDAHAES